MAEKKHVAPIQDASLKREVKDATQAAEKQAKTGDVETVKQSEGGPMTDLPTNTRRVHPPA